MEQVNRIIAGSVPEPNSGCWLWLGSIQKSGHGRIKWHSKTTPVHRISWLLFNGEIPDGKFVCHRCDVPCCVNPDHLFIGTCADNHADRNRKGRQAKGERHGRAKLTSDDIKGIKTDNRKISVIAREYNMGWSQIARIKNGTSWLT